MRSARGRRIALFALMFVPGLELSSWVTRTPAIRDLLHASIGEMAIILFGLSVGSMAGVLISGPLVARFGVRPIVALGMALAVLSMPAVAGGAAANLGGGVAAGLFLFGLGVGTSEVAVNVEASDVEKVLGRPVLPAVHGFFSVGMVAGAGIGVLLNGVDFPVVWHLLSMGAVSGLIFAIAIGRISPDTGRVERNHERTEGGPRRDRSKVYLDPRLLLVATVTLAMALAEGTANDWLPLLLVDGHGFDVAVGAGVYTVFAAAMAAARLLGGPLIERFGRPAVLCASALSAAVGIAVVAWADNQIAVGVAVLLWGFGAALGFPVTLSAAGDSGTQSAARVAFTATVGYVAFLVGPPLLGFLGDHLGLRTAIIVPLTAAVIAAVAATTIRTGSVPPRPERILGD